MSEEDKHRHLQVPKEPSSKVTSPTFLRPVSPTIAAAYDKAFRKVAEAENKTHFPDPHTSTSSAAHTPIHRPEPVTVFGTKEEEETYNAQLARLKCLYGKKGKSNNSKSKMKDEKKKSEAGKRDLGGGGGDNNEKDDSKPSKPTFEDIPELYALNIKVGTLFNHIVSELKAIENSLKSNPADIVSAESAVMGIDYAFEKFEVLQEEFLEKLMEHKKMEEYKDAVPAAIKLQQEISRLKLLISKKSPVKLHSSSGPDGGPQPVTYQEKVRFDMPKFDGQVKNWLSWWAAYKEFHEDPNCSAARKFQVLLQAMSPETRAYRCVASFPMSEENYYKAVEQLKTEFGDENMLIKVYVRELVKLIQENSKDKPTMSFPDMVTSLKSQLLNLESLGIDWEDNGALLYPIMESCVPARILEAYYSKTDCKQELRDFMDFLDNEVKKKLQSNLARVDRKEKEQDGNSKKTTSKGTRSSTTSSFVNTTEEKKCCFCNKTGHASSACRAAVKMTLEDKKRGACQGQGVLEVLQTRSSNEDLQI